MSAVHLSIVIPVRNDAASLAHLLDLLCSRVTPSTEIIVVDGESADDSREVARRAGVRVLSSRPGRGRQLNAGYLHARGDWLWFLHADAEVSRAALEWVHAQRGPGWGRFDVAFDPPTPAMAVIAGFMNARSRLTGICTGDQAIFVHRSLLSAAHGIPEQSLMEDVELSRRLKRLSVLRRPPMVVRTSPRRWRRDGILRTVFLMWWLRTRYWLGADPEALRRVYDR